MPETKARRRRREVVIREDGSQLKVTKPPRADVLWYPKHTWTTILVRRTHDLALATEMAEAAWAELAVEGQLVTHRVGWWTTYVSQRVPEAGATDKAGRVVLWCHDSASAASPGIEFRP